MEPQACAAFLSVLARYFGWSEHFILWELPMCRANAYAHALMRMHHVNTQPATNGLSAARDEI